MGTYALRLQVLSATDVDTQLAYQVGLDAYYVGVNLGGVATPKTDGTIAYISFGDCMYLDGSVTPISIAAVPLGFRLPGGAVTLRNYVGGALGTIIGRLWQRVGIAPVTDYSRVISQKGSYGPLTQTLVGSGGSNFVNISSLSFTPTEIIDLFSALTLRLIVTDATKFTTFAFKQLEFAGSYDLITWTWALANGVNFNVPNTSPVQVGRLYLGAVAGHPEEGFSISSGYPGTGSRAGGVGTNSNGTNSSVANGNELNIFNSSTNPLGTGPSFIAASGGDGVSSITFSWTVTATSGGIGVNGADSALTVNTTNYITVNNTEFDEWYAYFISFYFISFLPYVLPEDTLITVSIESDGFPAIPTPGGGTGTQFSGSVKLGVIKILNTAASGIYKIVADKTSDTLYIDSPTTDETANFKIPDPFAKTGFVGG